MPNSIAVVFLSSFGGVRRLAAQGDAGFDVDDDHVRSIGRRERLLHRNGKFVGPSGSLRGDAVSLGQRLVVEVVEVEARHTGGGQVVPEAFQNSVFAVDQDQERDRKPAAGSRVQPLDAVLYAAVA